MQLWVEDPASNHGAILLARAGENNANVETAFASLQCIVPWETSAIERRLLGSHCSDRAMRAVLVGGNGFIGSHLADVLLAEGWQVAVYDRAPERYRPPLPTVEYVHGELGNVGLLAGVLPRADVVFHLASTTIPQSSNDSPEFDIQSNLVDTVRFLEVCAASRVRKVVYLSSGGTVYGIPETLPVREVHPPTQSAPMELSSWQSRNTSGCSGACMSWSS